MSHRKLGRASARQRRATDHFAAANARNPRRNFSEDELDELTASLRERGMIRPIVARPVRGAPDAYEIIAGERRWRAAQRAGLHEVPVVIIEATDEESLQLAIIENVQRADLNPLEEAEGYRRWWKITATPKTTSPKWSARAAAMLPTRCGC